MKSSESGRSTMVATLMAAPLDLRLWEDWRLLAEVRDLRVDILPTATGDLCEATAALFEAEHFRRSC